MIEFLQRSWWVFLLRGLAAIGLGIMAFVWPTLTLAVLVTLFGAYLLVDGIFGLLDALRYRDWLYRVWPLALESGLSIVIGVLTLVWPSTSALALLMFIAAWAIVGGLLRVVLAFVIRKEITGEWILIAGGLLSILFGVLLIAMPQMGMIALIWVFGGFAVLFGALFVYLALHLRTLGKRGAAHS